MSNLALPAGRPRRGLRRCGRHLSWFLLAPALTACITPEGGALSESERQEIENISGAISTSVQEGTSSKGASHWHIPVGADGYGLAIGNPRRWTGLRLNLADHDVEEIRGIGLSGWTWKTPSVERMRGLNLGLRNKVVDGRGVAVSLLDAVAEDTSRGLQAAGAAVVAGGELRGISAGGLAVVAGSDTRGLNAGGLAVVSGGTQRGISLAGLANVAAKDSSGLSVGGLASVALGEQWGIHVGGLAVVSLGDRTGLGVAGLGNVSQGSIAGVSVGGLSNVAAVDIDGLAISGLATTFGSSFNGVGIAGLVLGDEVSVDLQSFFAGADAPASESSATGLMLAGYKVQAGQITGVTGALINRTNVLDGLAVGAYNRVTGSQTGLSVGLINAASELDGVQIGLLNYVEENPWWARWLPLVNARF